METSSPHIPSVAVETTNFVEPVHVENIVPIRCFNLKINFRYAIVYRCIANQFDICYRTTANDFCFQITIRFHRTSVIA
jgi:hypothetical protein